MIWLISRRSFLAMGLTASAGCSMLPGSTIPDPSSNPAYGAVEHLGDLSVSSPAMRPNGRIPNEYGHFFENKNPPLELAGMPAEAESWALVFDGPDAPGGTYFHWLVWNIPAEITEIPADWELPAGVVEGANSDGGSEYGYVGPDPVNKQTYRFKVFAVESLLDLPQGASAEALGNALKDRILAQTQLSAWYDFHTSAHDGIAANDTHSTVISDLFARF